MVRVFGRDVRKPAAIVTRPCFVKMLSEGRPGSKGWSLPVNDVYGDHEDEGDTEEDGVAVLQISWRFVVGADVYECQHRGF